MKLSPEAEAEIERLDKLIGADQSEWEGHNGDRTEHLRAAMVWAYRDAAYICRKGPFMGDRQTCADMIDKRANKTVESDRTST